MSRGPCLCGDPYCVRCFPGGAPPEPVPCPSCGGSGAEPPAAVLEAHQGDVAELAERYPCQTCAGLGEVDPDPDPPVGLEPDPPDLDLDPEAFRLDPLDLHYGPDSSGPDLDP